MSEKASRTGWKSRFPDEDIYLESDRGILYQGHVLDVLRKLPDESVDCIVTSPPYWGLRRYEGTDTVWGGDPNCEHEWGDTLVYKERGSTGGKTAQTGTHRRGVQGTESIRGQFCRKCGAWHGQLGLEPTLDLYLVHLWQISDELYRVLKPTGVVFWNHGDSYGTSGKYSTRASMGGATTSEGPFGGKRRVRNRDTVPVDRTIPPKCMAMQNYRFILGLIDIDYRILIEWRAMGRPDGELEEMLRHPRIQEILRNSIIWHKPNHMPSSVKDRFTNAYEPVFMLVKNVKPVYYYNTKTGLMVDKKPLGVKGVEGVDWDYDVELVYNKETESYERRMRYDSSGRPKKISHWKSIDYWFDLDAVRVPHKTNPEDLKKRVVLAQKRKRESISGEHFLETGGWVNCKPYAPTLGKNPGDVWEAREDSFSVEVKDKYGVVFGAGNIPFWMVQAIYRTLMAGGEECETAGDLWKIPTQPFPEAHFATFSERLIEPMIKAGCPQWICKKCGKPRVRIVERRVIDEELQRELEQRDWGVNPLGQGHHGRGRASVSGGGTANSRPVAEIYAKTLNTRRVTVGWTRCDCNAGWEAGIVLDPFMGSGTTALVAEKLGRNWIGIELNPSYCEIARKRLGPFLSQKRLEVM